MEQVEREVAAAAVSGLLRGGKLKGQSSRESHIKAGDGEANKMGKRNEGPY
jgi:hypothetical protein